MHTDNSNRSVIQDAPVILSRLALPEDRYLIHELSIGPDHVLCIRLGVTYQRGGILKPLDPFHSVTFTIDQIEGYEAAVKSVAAKVRAKKSSAPAPSFAKQVSLAAFHRRRAGQ